MKFNIANNQETAKLMQQIQIDAGQLNVSDFQWFVSTIVQTMDGKIPKVDFRYDTESGLDVITGKITKAEINYTQSVPKNSSISITYTNLKTNVEETVNFEFDAELVEENKNSVSGQFMKYYINDSDHKVIVGIIFYYK